MKDQCNYNLHRDNMLWSIAYHNPYKYINKGVSKRTQFLGKSGTNSFSATNDVVVMLHNCKPSEWMNCIKSCTTIICKVGNECDFSK